MEQIIFALMYFLLAVDGSFQNLRCATTFSDILDVLSLVSCPTGCKSERGQLCGYQVYDERSNVCLAAIHAGYIRDAGGDLAVLREAIARTTTYPGYNVNGVQTTECNISETYYSFLQFTEASETFTTNSILTQCRCYAGIKDGQVKDFQMTASSSFLNRVPSKARLDGDLFWVTMFNDSEKWLQVDFLKSTTIYGVITQGGTLSSTIAWVKNFEMSSSNDGGNFKFIEKDSDIKLFEGNSDATGHKVNRFNPPVTARYFRLHVKDYAVYPRLRLEYLTC